MRPILITLNEIADEHTHKESSIKASGLLKHIESFEFVFGMKVCLTIFNHTDMLSCTLQSASVGIGDALVAVKLAVASLERARSQEMFESIYSRAER